MPFRPQFGEDVWQSKKPDLTSASNSNEGEVDQSVLSAKKDDQAALNYLDEQLKLKGPKSVVYIRSVLISSYIL